MSDPDQAATPVRSAGQSGRAGPTRSAARRRWHFAAILILVLAAVALVLGYLRPAQPSMNRAEAGDCLIWDRQRFEVASCAEPDARFVVTGRVADPQQCIDTPGSTRTWVIKQRVWCIGDKGVDPATTVNAIMPGACLRFGSHDNPRRSPCATGAVTVLQVLRDLPKTATSAELGQACRAAGAAATASTFAWGIYVAGRADAAWDRVLCLGPELP